MYYSIFDRRREGDIAYAAIRLTGYAAEIVPPRCSSPFMISKLNQGSEIYLFIGTAVLPNPD